MSAENVLDVEEVNAELDRLNDDLVGTIAQARGSSDPNLGFPGFSRSESNSNRRELNRFHIARYLPRSLPSSPTRFQAGNSVRQVVQRFDDLAHVGSAASSYKVESVVLESENLSQELSSSQESFWSWTNTSSLSLGSDFSDQDLYTSNYSNMPPSVAQTNANMTNLMALCVTAEADLRLAMEACENEGSRTCLIQSHAARLVFWKDRLLKLEAEIEKYTGTVIDTYSVLKTSEDTRQNIVSYEIYLLGVVAERLASSNPERVEINPGPRIIKVNASPFPEFDGKNNYEIWETEWKTLAENSGLNSACKLIKLKESIIGNARNYIGEFGMSTLDYDHIWEKLAQRYNQKWFQAQQACRNFYGIQNPAEDIASVTSFVDTCRSAIDQVEKGELSAENIMLNVCLDGMPDYIRILLVEKLTVECPNWKFTKAAFEVQFSRIIALLEHKSRTSASNMYHSSAQGATASGFNSRNSMNTYHHEIPSQQQQHNQGAKSKKIRKLPTCVFGCETPHFVKDCIYDTPLKRRDRLALLKKCQACSVPLEEHGRKCSSKATCSHHPNDQHLYWTCDGRDTAHPGPQAVIRALSTRNSRGSDTS